MKKKICPMCNREIIGYPSLSRRDNKTEICSDCGVREAILDYYYNERKKKENEKEAN